MDVQKTIPTKKRRAGFPSSLPNDMSDVEALAGWFGRRIGGSPNRRGWKKALPILHALVIYYEAQKERDERHAADNASADRTRAGE